MFGMVNLQRELLKLKKERRRRVLCLAGDRPDRFQVEETDLRGLQMNRCLVHLRLEGVKVQILKVRLTYIYTSVSGSFEAVLWLFGWLCNGVHGMYGSYCYTAAGCGCFPWYCDVAGHLLALSASATPRPQQRPPHDPHLSSLLYRYNQHNIELLYSEV